MECHDSDDHLLIDCGTQLDRKTIQRMKSVFEKALSAGKPVVLEASNISRVDTASLQLLVAFAQAAEKINLVWRWQSPASPLIQMANLIGVRDLIRLPQLGQGQ